VVSVVLLACRRRTFKWFLLRYNLFSVAEGWFGPIEKNFSGPSGSVVRLQISPLNADERLSFIMLWFKCIFTNTDTAENDQNLYVTMGVPGPIPGSLGAVICTGYPSISSALILEIFLGTADISSNFKMSEPHGLCSVLLTAPLCSRDGDGCHSERTAAQ